MRTQLRIEGQQQDLVRPIGRDLADSLVRQGYPVAHGDENPRFGAKLALQCCRLRLRIRQQRRTAADLLIDRSRNGRPAAGDLVAAAEEKRPILLVPVAFVSELTGKRRFRGIAADGPRRSAVSHGE